MHSTTYSISVLSGKGGVGKTNIALNLCFALHQAAHSVLLMDCDMGLANIDILLGIAPERHIQDILSHNADPADIRYPIGPKNTEGFDLLPTNSGMAGFVELDAMARDILRERINPLADHYDFLVLDSGAGISPTVLGFGAMTDMRLLIVTPEPTSLTDSYALMKVLSNHYSITDFYILVNQVESPEEGKRTFNRLAMTSRHFLGFTPTYLGYVHSDPQLINAVRRQRPLLEVAPSCPAARDYLKAAGAIEKLRESQMPFPPEHQPLRQIAGDLDD